MDDNRFDDPDENKLFGMIRSIDNLNLRMALSEKTIENAIGRIDKSEIENKLQFQTLNGSIQSLDKKLDILVTQQLAEAKTRNSITSTLAKWLLPVLMAIAGGSFAIYNQLNEVKYGKEEARSVGQHPKLGD